VTKKRTYDIFVTATKRRKNICSELKNRIKEVMQMTKAEILKREILAQYKSVRQFAIDMSIPYSTLVTALDRGIEGMAYGTVIRMCDKLNLNPVDFSTLEKGTDLGNKIVENRVMQQYVKLNKVGRKKVLDYMGDLTALDKYQA
jgi:hypothetical protein